MALLWKVLYLWGWLDVLFLVAAHRWRQRKPWEPRFTR